MRAKLLKSVIVAVRNQRFPVAVLEWWTGAWWDISHTSTPHPPGGTRSNFNPGGMDLLPAQRPGQSGRTSVPFHNPLRKSQGQPQDAKAAAAVVVAAAAATAVAAVVIAAAATAAVVAAATAAVVVVTAAAAMVAAAAVAVAAMTAAAAMLALAVAGAMAA